MNKLGSATFVYDGIRQDYNFVETLNCLYDLSDELAVAFGGTDGTLEAIAAWYKSKDYGKHKKITLIAFTEEEWHAQRGREKLSYFSNLAINALDSEWVFYLQADEILHESCFDAVRQAIEHNVDGYLVARYNLWKDPRYMLNVVQERKPCSTEVIRLARRGTQAVGDAESITAATVHVWGDPDNRSQAIHNIAIWHMGFIRDPVKHLEKIRHIQDDVFLIDHDKRIDGMTVFDPEVWFSDADLIPVPGELPVYVMEWCRERYPEVPI